MNVDQKATFLLHKNCIFKKSFFSFEYFQISKKNLLILKWWFLKERFKKLFKGTKYVENINFIGMEFDLLTIKHSISSRIALDNLQLQ
jgi:hypothetical protein